MLVWLVMRIASFHGCVLVMLLCALACLSGCGNSAVDTKAPDVVLEATSVVHGISSYTVLFIRLTSDGRVEWDESLSFNDKQRNSAMISPEELSSIQHRLNAIDKSGIQPQMGPFAGYTDVVIDLNVVLTATNGPVRFTVTNPWTGDLRPFRDDRIKPMPTEVKSIACEIWNLHAQFVKMQAEPMCKSPQDPKNKKK
jgi:hypothetical protein